MADYQGKSGIWGGPTDQPEVQNIPAEPGLEAGLAMAANPVSLEKVPESPAGTELAMGAIQDPGRVFPSIAGTSLLIYKVRPGDTLSTIAEDFGVSSQAILAQNPDVKTRALRVGQELSIQPVASVVYQMRPEESLELVAMKHGVTVEAIKELNKTVSLAGTGEGATIVIPPVSAKTPAKSEPGLPALKGYFAMPTTGFNWGKLHNNNGVDIANACGTNVVAAQEGMVITAEAAGWNGGYGEYIDIEHPNGTKTRYAHLEKLFVSVGDYVDQREKIGLMGNTGESTGCHLHFEVSGAKNPFVK